MSMKRILPVVALAVIAAHTVPAIPLLDLPALSLVQGLTRLAFSRTSVMPDHLPHNDDPIPEVDATRILWSSSSGNAWLTGSNWTGGAVPTAAQIAQFGVNPTSSSTGVGINFASTTNAGTQVNGQRVQEVGAIEISSNRTNNFLIGNSSSTSGASGTLRPLGATVNDIDNVIIRHAGAGTFTIQNTQGGGNQLMSLELVNDGENLVNIDGAGSVVISCEIRGAGKHLTLGGTGFNGGNPMALRGANTYSGNTIVKSGMLALELGGSISASPVIELWGGTIFDVTGLNTPLTLSSGQILRASGSSSTARISTIGGGTPKGLTTASNSGLEFTSFDGNTPPLTVGGSGVLALQASNTLTVTIANGGNPLGVGDYKLIAKLTTGSVTGLPMSLTVNGDGVDGTSSLVLINGELYLRVEEGAGDPGEFNFDPVNYNPGEGDGTVTLTVTRTGGSDGAVSVDYGNNFEGKLKRRVEGSAAPANGGLACDPGIDYISPSGTLNFADGETSKTFNVTICEDIIFEGSEAFTVELGNATGGATIGANNSSIVFIADNDASTDPSGTGNANPSSVSITDNSLLTVTVTPGTNPASTGITVIGDLSLIGGSATQQFFDDGTNGDVTPGDNVFSFEAFVSDTTFPGEKLLPVTISDAQARNSATDITLNINAPSGAGVVEFVTGVFTGSESDGTVTVTVDRDFGFDDPQGPVTVDYSFTSATATGGASCATPGVDFVNTGGTLAWAHLDGSTKTINVAVCNDAEIEGDETFTATLSNPQGGVIIGATGSAVVSITDDDAGPGLFVVTKTADTNDGLCDADCSLREAVSQSGGGSTITFASPLFDSPQVITLSNGELLIAKNLTINGPGANLLTLDAGGASRGFRLPENETTIAISALTITGGSADRGAGIYSQATLTLSAVTIDDNIATEDAGGIWLSGPTTITDSTISNNTENPPFGIGGGIVAAADLTIQNSTVSGNSALSGGSAGGIAVILGTAAIGNCTITENEGGMTGGVAGNGGIVNMTSSIVAANNNNTVVPDISKLSPAFNVSRSVIGNPGNVIIGGGLSNKGGTGASPLDPVLGPLADNGGTTKTHAVLAGSPAIDNGISNGLAADQRGLSRTSNHPAINNAADGTDSGSFELQIAPGPPQSGTVNVGAGEPITSLTNPGGLFEVLNSGGLSGNLTVNLTSDLTAETGAIFLNQLVESGGSGYTLQFQASGGQRLVSGSTSTFDSLITLDGSDRVTFSGSAHGPHGITFRNTGNGVLLTLQNDATNNSLSGCIFEGNGDSIINITRGVTTVSGNDNNSVVGNIIRDLAGDENVAARLLVNASSSNSNTLIADNELYDFSVAAIFVDNAENTAITGNTIYQTAPGESDLTAIQIWSTAGTSTISGNTIRDIVNFGLSRGIHVFESGNVTVSANRIYNITNLGGDVPIYGIHFETQFDGSSTLTVVNNMISIAPATPQNQSITGVLDDGSAPGSTFTAHHNSIYIGGSNIDEARTSWAILRSNISQSNHTAINNIAYNGRTGPGNQFAAGDRNPGVGTYAASNNLFVGTGPNTNDFMNYGLTAITFAEWQTGPPARDANSQAGVAGSGAFTLSNIFISDTDLHAAQVSTNPASNAGTPLATVTTDFDGDVRSLTTPDIGADEFELAAQPGELNFDPDEYNPGEGDGTVTLTVTRTGGSDGAVSVDYGNNFEGTTFKRRVEGSAAPANGGLACDPGIDYISPSGTLNFADGETSKTFNVTICEDAIFEGLEAFTVELGNATGGATIGANNSSIVFIADNDSVPNITIGDVTQAEGDAGTSNFTFTVSLSNPTTQDVFVNYSTANGTAVAPGDYTAVANGGLTIPTGATSGPINISVNGDTDVEPDETFFVSLTNPTNANITDNQGVGTIENDDVAIPTFVVTKTADTNDGACDADCSLREAITAANALPDANIIAFNIPGGVFHTINATEPMPAITQTVTIDATTQPGYSGTPSVELKRGGLQGSGLTVQAGPTTIRGLAINGWFDGILVSSGSAVIQRNFIGTDLAASGIVTGNTSGVRIAVGAGSSIIGTDGDGVDDSLEGNLIGNNSTGVDLDNTAGGNRVAGNRVGVFVDNGLDEGLGNGINIDISSSPNNVIGTNGDGISDALEGNLIKFADGGPGIRIIGNAAIGNTLRRNSINDNGGAVASALGIDLFGNGPTANDAGDADIGPNDLQNFPVITSVLGGASPSIDGTLNSTPGQTFTIDFYSSPSCNPALNFGEGNTYLGTVTTGVTDVNGNVAFSFAPAALDPDEPIITATATNSGGSTSEFSQCRAIGTPDISVRGNGINIVDGDATPSLADHTDFGSANVSAGTITRTFTIFNFGTANLNLTGNPVVEISGTNAGDFTMSVAPATPVGADSSTEVQITFDPSATGLRTATVSIANNDPDENPFDFAIQGTGTASANLSADPTSVNFGNVTVGGPAGQSSVVITNNGASVEITAVPITGTHAADFDATPQTTLPVVLNNGESLTVNLTFTPAAIGAREASMGITSSPESTLSIPLSGTGVAPDIDVSPLTLSYGDQPVNTTSSSQSVTISNNGGTTLNIVDLSTSSPFPGEFSITNSPANTVPPGGSIQVDIVFTPTAVGVREGFLSIISDDPDEGQITVDLDGTGTAPGGTFAFSPIEYLTREGTIAVVSVSRSSGSAGAASVDFSMIPSGGATAGAACTEGVDFITASGTLNWADGDAAPKTFNVTVCADELIETPQERALMQLSNPSPGATIGQVGSQGDVDILDIASQFCSTDGPIVVPPTSGTPPFASAPYPSSINVSGVPGVIQRLSVTLNGVTHADIGDLDILLVGPEGQKFILMSDVGFGPINDVTFTFHETNTPNALGVSGVYRPTNFEAANDVFAAGAPLGPYADPGPGGTPAGTANLDAAFSRADPNGTWQLFVSDDSDLDGGSIQSWCLLFETVQPGSIQFASDTASVGEATATVDLTVTRTDGTDGQVLAPYEFNVGGTDTATGGESCDGLTDYINTTDVVFWADGDDTDQIITVPICNDAILENGETFTVTLSVTDTGNAPAALGSPSTATVTITDDDVSPTPTPTPTPTPSPVILVVDNLSDNGTLNQCDDGTPNDCSLRGSNSIANDGDTITFDAGLFAPSGVSAEGGAQAIVLGGTEIVINSDVTITGPGATLLAVSGDNLSRVFLIAPGSTVTISGLAIVSGQTSGSFPTGFGAGIYNDEATLTLNSVVVAANTASGFGGGIYNDSGTVTVANSTISGNTSVNESGGGIASRNTSLATATLSVIASTISGNTATGGGGIYNDGTCTVVNSTISGNTAIAGGGIWNIPLSSPATLNVRNSTIAFNTGTSNGGGIRNDGDENEPGTVTLSSTIVSDNSSPNGPDILNSDILQGSYNLVETTTGYTFSSGSDNIFGVDPMLGPLADNGGPTLTHKPQHNFPGHDKGCAFGATTDQRGYGRTIDWPSIPNGQCTGSEGAVVGLATDIGAVELLLPTAAPATISGRVTNAFGRGLSGVTIRVDDVASGEFVRVNTNTFGYYTVHGLTTGTTYTVSARSKRYSFGPPLIIALDDNFTGANFIADP